MPRCGGISGNPRELCFGREVSRTWRTVRRADLHDNHCYPRGAEDPQAQISGIQAWLVELDRKLRIRTAVVAAALLLGLAAVAVALVLAITTRDDAATKTELDALDARISGVERRAGDAIQQDVADLQSQISDLDRRVSRISDDSQATERQIDVLKDDINDVRGQISELNAGG